MGQPTNTFSAYDSVGNREDLSEFVYDISPTATPFLSALERVPCTSTKHEWQTHALTAASSSNFVIEGDDATTDAGTATTRVYNYTGISDKVALVSGTVDVIKKAGRRSEMAFQMANRTKELKRDQEKILLENQAYVSGTDTLARKVAGAQAWIKTNTSIDSGATASTGDGSDAHTDSATTRPLLESYAETVLASCWDNGGEPTMGICGKFQKRKIASWSGSATKTMDASKKVLNTVDVYMDPLGNEIKFVPCRQAPTDVVFFFDMEHVKLAVLRDYQTAELAKTGDSTRKQILTEYTLEMCNEKAHGGIYDLTTS
jgi:hypothetical protein